MSSVERDALVVGTTFEVKDRIKEIGGNWSPQQNGWRVPAAHRAQAEQLAGETKGVKVLDARALRVEGKAYEAREELKAIGGRWNENLKAWVAPLDSREGVEKLGLKAVEIDTPAKTPHKSREALAKVPSPLPGGATGPER